METAVIVYRFSIEKLCSCQEARKKAPQAIGFAALLLIGIGASGGDFLDAFLSKVSSYRDE